MADKAIWQSAVVDDAGNLVTDAMVEVRADPGGGLATLKSDRAGASGLANPFPATGGFATFYTDPGTYKITTTSPTAGSRIYRYVVLLVNATADQTGTEYLSSNITSGTVEDFDAGGSLDRDVGVLDLNPSAGNTTLASMAWDDFPDGAEVTITNVHASNVLTIKSDGGSPSTGKGFRGAYDLALPQYGSATVKKSVGANRWIIQP